MDFGVTVLEKGVLCVTEARRTKESDSPSEFDEILLISKGPCLSALIHGSNK